MSRNINSEPHLQPVSLVMIMPLPALRWFGNGYEESYIQFRSFESGRSRSMDADV
jgi:hypothetical protein